MAARRPPPELDSDDEINEEREFGPKDKEKYVPARLKGPNHEKIMEQAAIISKDFMDCIARLEKKKKERPKEDVWKLLQEEPFHSDAIAVQQKLFEEDRKALEGQELEHKWEPTGLGIKVVTVEEEERMIAAIERRNAREARRKAKMQEWNPDQNRAKMKEQQLQQQQLLQQQLQEQHEEHPQQEANPDEEVFKKPIFRVKKRPGESSSAFPAPASFQPSPSLQLASSLQPASPLQAAVALFHPEQQGICVSCEGPCALDSRRSLMSCTNEPMLPELMADLLGQFYRLGWMTGSGGAMAAISCDNRLLLSPSSLQKERIKACDLFTSMPNSREVKAPSCMPHGKPTACQGIFKLIMEKTGAQCVIHGHSKASNLVTQILRGHGQWAIANQEYIKGIYNFRTREMMTNNDILIVPIIENMPTEEDLEPQVAQVLNASMYMHCSAILVRNHGVFVWGPTWQKTKIMAEIYEYLFDISLDLHKLGVPLYTSEDLARALTTNHLSYGLDAPQSQAQIAQIQAAGLVHARAIAAAQAALAAAREQRSHSVSDPAPPTPSAPPADD